MQQAIKPPYTVPELINWCSDNNKSILQGLDFFAPWPTAPEGYILDPKSEDRWVGPETVHRGWILTQTWYGRSNTHYVELWLDNHNPPNYSPLTPAEATELASALLQVTQTARTESK